MRILRLFRRLTLRRRYQQETKLLTLSDIMFRHFQRFLIEGDVSVLGEGPEDILSAHATALYEQYLDLTSTDDSNARIGYESILIAYEAKLYMAENLVIILEDRYDPLIAKLLREDFDYELTEETYLQDLQSISVEMQSLLLNRNLAAQELGEQRAALPATYRYFADLLVAISAQLKFNIDDSISVMTFCSYLQAFIARGKAAQQKPVEDE